MSCPTAFHPTLPAAAAARSTTPARATAAVTATAGEAPGVPGGSPGRAAAHRARWPPAECPTAGSVRRSTSG